MELLPCHSRRELPGETRVFFCAHPKVHARAQRVDAILCKACEYCALPAPDAFRQYPPPPGLYSVQSCRHLGEQTGLRDCKSCGGNIQLKVFACRHPDHPETTLAECQLCRDFSTAAAN